MGNHQPLPNPAPSPNVRRFRTNPVEIAIFSVVTLIFFNSVYSLFYDQGGFKPAALSPMAANPVSEGRSPASEAPSFANLDVRCDTNPDQTTVATKVRLAGALCSTSRAPASEQGSEQTLDPSKLAKVSIVNTANMFTATVFTDVSGGKFTTDYIPLNAGKNPIHLEFSYRDGSTVSQDLNVVKN